MAIDESNSKILWGDGYVIYIENSTFFHPDRIVNLHHRLLAIERNLVEENKVSPGHKLNCSWLRQGGVNSLVGPNFCGYCGGTIIKP